MINFLFSNIKSIGIAIIAFIGIYILRKNKTLKLEKEQLQQDITTKDRVIDVQNKVMEATSNIEHTDLDSSLERMSKSKK